MDIKKAVEIVESKGVIDVNCNGKSVWIENVDNENQKVLVKDLKNEKRFIVDPEELKEM